MQFSQLLSLINDAQNPEQILSKLHEEQFAITDNTEEGSSVLHALAQSKHAKNFLFDNFLTKLIAAGANLNAVDAQNKSFLSYYLEQECFSRKQTFAVLVGQSSFDPNYTTANTQTFFEVICNVAGSDALGLLNTLFGRSDFDPNQKTSKHKSILLHLIAENARDEFILTALANKKINTKIKNDEGKTALGLILSQTRYKSVPVIQALITNAQNEIDTLDNDGNNYLQLTILTKHQCEEIAHLLFQASINWTHRNNEGKSIFDLIKENKAQRSEYSNKKLLLDIVKSHPQALFERYSNGRTVLYELLLSSSDYSIRPQLSELFNLCRANGYNDKLNHLIAQCFDDYKKAVLSEDVLINILEALPKDQDFLDVEYCFAHALLSDSEYLRAKLQKITSSFDVKKLTTYIEDLTPADSAERSRALDYLHERTWNLDAFDDATLAYEEQYHSYSFNSAVDTAKNTKLFGHLFSLDGFIPVDSTKVDLSGSSSYDSSVFMVHLMNAYFADCVKNGTNEGHLDAIRQVRNMTVKAMRIYCLATQSSYYSIKNTAFIDVFAAAIADGQSTGVELISGWSGHAISLIIKKDSLYRNNGGGCSTDQAIEQYKITKSDKLTKGLIAPIVQNNLKESNKKYIQQELHELLGLDYIGSIPGAFQRVGNCSFHSLLLALKVKYRLFIADEQVADALFADTLKFFEKLYLKEYIALYENHPALPQVLTRLLVQKLIPEKKSELSSSLLSSYFGSEAAQEVLRTELMIERFLLITRGKPTNEFEQQLQLLGINLEPISTREQILSRILNNQITQADLVHIGTWSAEEQCIQGYPLLHFAVINNKLELAALLIKQFPNSVNQTNWYDQEALCLVNSVEMVELLVANGAILTRTDYDNPLDRAILANNVNVVRALLKHGALASENSAYYAASKDPQILKLLLKFNPSAMKKTTHDYSASIHAAARSGSAENIRTLVYYGGQSTGSSDVNGIMPLHHALKKGHDEAAKLLLEYPGTLFKRPYRGDSFAAMTANGDLQNKIKQLELERQGDIAAFEQFKASKPGIVEEDLDYLMLAISTNRPSVIRGCLITYPNLSVVKNSELYCNTPLTRAIHNTTGKKGKDYDNALAIIGLLLKTPAININACMASTEPMIFMATSIGNVDILELFLADPDLDLNQQDNVGYTALHDAVERGHWKCVSRLLQDERLDSTIRNKRNLTAGELECGHYSPDNCIDKVREHQNDLEISRASQILGMAV